MRIAIKKLLCVLLTLTLGVCGFSGTALAAAPSNESVTDTGKFEVVSKSMEPIYDQDLHPGARVVRGYNYSYIVNYDGSLVAVVRGSVKFSIDNGKTRVSSPAPTIDYYEDGFVVSASVSASTSGTSGVLTVTTKARCSWSILNKTFYNHIKCSAGGTIAEY